MKEHLFVSSTDGALYDTRTPQWHKTNPLRANYSRSHREINSTADFKATLRAGAYAWPGGYQMFLITSDGAALCFDCARKESRQILPSIASKSRDGWRVIACDINYEDLELYCDHCSKLIPASYSA